MDQDEIRTIAAKAREEMGWTALSGDWGRLIDDLKCFVQRHDPPYICVELADDFMNGNDGFFAPQLKEIQYREGLIENPASLALVLAHETMHLLLGHKELIELKINASDNAGFGVSSWLGQDHPRSVMEAEANAGALELLFPADLVAERVMGGESIEQLAQEIETTPLNLAIQLAAHHARSVQSLTGSCAASNSHVEPTSFELSEQQRAAVHTDDPFVMVSAGPGCGKTTALAHRVHHLLEAAPSFSEDREHHEFGNKVLTLSYSRAAAAELNARLGHSNGATSDVWSSTIHAFARALLHETDYDQRSLDVVLTPLAKHDLWLEAMGAVEMPGEEFFGKLDGWAKFCAELVEHIQSTNLDMASPEAFQNNLTNPNARLVVWFLEVWSAYETLKLERGACDFGDLVVLAARALAEDESVKHWVRTHIRHVLVDELQDTNPTQQAVLEHLAQTVGNFWGVGDERQAIYRFQGARPDVLERIAARFGSTRFELTLNRRSVPEIVKAAEHMASVGDHTDFGHEFQAICASKPHNNLPAITLVETRSRAQLESELLDNIALAQQDGTDLNNIAILCERQASARKVRRILTRANIPYKSARSIDPRGPWSSILAVWAEVCWGSDFDERSEERIRFVLAQRGMNTSEIDETVGWARRTTAQLGADSDFQNAPTPFVAAVSMVYELAWLKPENSSKQNRPDIDAFLACARANAHAAAWTSRADLWRSYRVVYEALREAVMEGKPIRPDTFDQDIGDGIRVSTIHQSKGTEFDVVIAFDASVQWDPPDAAQHLRLLDELEEAFGDVEFRPSQESEEAQFEALWFVALTRARHAFVALTTPKKSLVSQLSDLDENGFAEIRSSQYKQDSTHARLGPTPRISLSEELEFEPIPLAQPSRVCELYGLLAGGDWPTYWKQNENLRQQRCYEKSLARAALQLLDNQINQRSRSDTDPVSTFVVEINELGLEPTHLEQVLAWGREHLEYLERYWEAWLEGRSVDQLEVIEIEQAVQEANLETEVMPLRDRYVIVEDQSHGDPSRTLIGLTTKKCANENLNKARYGTGETTRHMLELATNHLGCSEAHIYNLREKSMSELDITQGGSTPKHVFSERVKKARELIESGVVIEGENTPEPHRCRGPYGCPYVAACPIFHPV